MIDVDSRINKALEGSDALALGDAYRNEIKQLIRDVLGEVKPERDNMTIPPEAHNSYGAGEKHGRNGAIDEIEMRIKDLGL